MLASNSLDHGVPITPAVSKLQVELPQELSNFFNETGYTTSNCFEARGTARLRVRDVITLQCVSAPHFVRRDWVSAQVLIKDVSRTGIGLLVHEQMWPGEMVQVEIMERSIQARVVRCRRIQSRCYEVGLVMCTISSVEHDAAANGS